MKRRKLCSIREHVWEKKKGGYELCLKCGTRFPCKNLDCMHIDCYEARGCRGQLPPGMEAHDKPKPPEE